MSAKYGNSFLGLDCSKKRKVNNTNEVHQSKIWKAQNITLELFQEERAKSASNSDFFILFLTVECKFYPLKNLEIVDASNWNEHFGPFASRAHLYSIVGPLNIN